MLRLLPASLLPPLKRLIIGGASRPSTLVAVFHGLGGSMHELQPTAEKWSSALPSTAFALFQAPNTDYHARELLSGEFSGDWYKFPRLRSSFGEDEDGYVEMVTRCVSERCDHVSREIDELLDSIGLADDRLICAGFSQGAAVSAYTGLRRRCLGVLPFGGPCPPRPSLLPDHDETRVCVVVGSSDHCVAHEELTHAFSKYRAADETCGVHVIPRQGHFVSSESEAIGLAFLRASGCT